MEEKNNKLGPGIWIISVLLIIGAFIGIFSGVKNIINPDATNQLLLQTGFTEDMLPTKMSYIIGLVFAAINMVSVVLILLKKKIGVIIFFVSQILSLVYSTISSGVGFGIFQIIGLVVSLLFYGLFAYFIYKKKHVFNFSTDESM